ncbi:helix-turn-helix domain-containing protein [[Kitasatospora] papulosa]|uniref:helix-turn-helix domain-containing protein n=1 Tax=[Kitasatospora] papulosa TaxID=1464011 RepID=UPI0036AA7A97
MAGRSETAVPADASPPVRELAERLRKVRAAAGLTYVQLSQMSGFSTASLSRAASGRSVPSRAIVDAFATTAGLSASGHAELVQLHERAAKTSTTPAEKVEAASRRDSLQFVQESFRQAMGEQARRDLLRNLHQKAGRPSIREIANGTGLSRSTVHRVLTRGGTGNAKEVADSLVARLAPEIRDDWAARVVSTFEPKSAVTPKPPLYRATDAAQSPEVDQAFTEFVSSVRRMRNLIAHGRVQTGAQFAAHVMELASLVQNDRRHPPFREEGSAPDVHGPAWTEPLQLQEVTPEEINIASSEECTKLVWEPEDLPSMSEQASSRRGEQ